MSNATTTTTRPLRHLNTISGGGKLILSVNAGSSSLKISVYELVNAGAHGARGGARGARGGEGGEEGVGPGGAGAGGVGGEGAGGEGGERREPVVQIYTASFANIGNAKAASGGCLFSFSSSESSPPRENDSKEEQDKKDISAKKNPLPDIKTHEDGFEFFLEYLVTNTHFDEGDIAHVCHRVVHGGDYPHAVVIDKEAYERIERLSDLAPLHNGAALAVIKSSIEKLSNSNSIAFFDSAFHSTMPKYISHYAIDPEIAQKKGLKKYGFHGLSYSYILRSVSSHLKKAPSSTSLIACHLGSGASICAIRNGSSLDTSMGLTPLSGLPGGTRAGSVDPSLIFHYTSHAGRLSQRDTKGMHITEAEQILNKKSGFLALTGTTDFAVISREAFNDDVGEGEEGGKEKEKYKLAFDIFLDRIVDFVAAYFVKLGGSEYVDALVFAGGIGERSVVLRQKVVEKVACLGFGIDQKLNEGVDDVGGDVVEIGEGMAYVKTLVCRTDEQIEMARQCVLNGDFAH